MMREFASPFPSVTWLIPELKIGDEASWNALCEKFRVGLTSRAHTYVHSNQGASGLHADDLVQESFLRAWKSRSRFRGENTAQFARWILTILRNCFLDFCKSRQARLPTGTWYEFATEKRTPVMVVVSLEREAALQSCIAELSQVYREVICMRHFEGLKFREIAKKLNKSPSTIAGQYRRAIEQMESMLSNENI